MSEYDFDWSQLAFASKKPLRQLQATFVAAPRELSAKRLKQLVTTYLPKGDIIFGAAKEPFILGFEDQPQFATLPLSALEKLVSQVNGGSQKQKVYVLQYFQRELSFIIEKLQPKRAVLVNGSWHHTFHNTKPFYQLVSQHIPYELVSPFTDEVEAKAYAERQVAIQCIHSAEMATESQLLELALLAARQSYDYGFQTGAVLAKREKPSSKHYRLLGAAHNQVVPYETYAMHYGASRETNFSPAHDLNHYDTVHAEMLVMLQALEAGQSLVGTTLCVNLMPCPACARTIATSGISDILYEADHSDSYAYALLTRAGKQVRRLS